MNKVILVGRLTKDVDYRQNGDSTVARFGIAVDRKFKDKDGNYGCDFINAVAFGKTADFISKYFSKGMRIGLAGHIQTGTYTDKDGNKRNSFDVVVDECEFVESKNAQNNAQSSFPAPTDGFMNIPADIPESLPFN